MTTSTVRMPPDPKRHETHKDAKLSNQVKSNSAISDNAMIALYYCYPPNGIRDVSFHADFQRDICSELLLGGRIRVSQEGINGVLSGSTENLKEYELKLRRELGKLSMEEDAIENGCDAIAEATALKQTYEWLDIKYCRLRNEIPVEQQIFDSLSVKITKEVVSLFDFSAPTVDGCQTKSSKRCRQRRKQKRKENAAIEAKMNACALNASKSTSDDVVRSGEQGTNKSSESSITTPTGIGGAFTIKDWEKYSPAEHLSPEEWNDTLLSLSQQRGHRSQPHTVPHLANSREEEEDEVILLDARNIYETRVGHFAVPNLATFFPNTRKFSSLPMALNTPEAAEALAGKKVFMYCTGGVRCERAGSYLRALSESNSGAWKNKQAPKGIYQLRGGIQKYLEKFGEPLVEKIDFDCDLSDVTQASKGEVEDHSTPSVCLYRGKNFVFDPRRTDPVVGHGITQSLPSSKSLNCAGDSDCQNTSKNEKISLIGRCILCSTLHDDYDNGHAPSEGFEARCCRCRVLVLICNNCRANVRCWGEQEGGVELFCGDLGKTCVDEGNIAENVETIIY